ncbi:DMT family transporter [Pseudaeromonas sharmana]|uniref:DMT family transporter n=1 Tax=Pseudaeromonas sharmana TaxID=328412 RepID=A0ABV8CN26_9GAMM
MSGHDERKAWGYALLTVLFWSTVATAFKLSLRFFAPAQLLLVAVITSVLLLGGILASQRRLAVAWRTLSARPGHFLLLGTLNPALYYLLLFEAYARLPAQQAQAINYTWAIALSLLAVPFLGQALRRRDLVAIVLAYLGALIIATRGDVLALHFDSVTGVVLALMSTLIWAGYWLLNARQQEEPVLSLFLTFCCSLPLILLACGILADFRLIAWQGWVGALYIGLFEMGIAFVCWLQALRLTRHAARISNLIFLSPFLSLLLLRWFANEPIASATPLGLAFIVLALLIQQWRRKTAAD